MVLEERVREKCSWNESRNGKNLNNVNNLLADGALGPSDDLLDARADLLEETTLLGTNINEREESRESIIAALVSDTDIGNLEVIGGRSLVRGCSDNESGGGDGITINSGDRGHLGSEKGGIRNEGG